MLDGKRAPRRQLVVDDGAGTKWLVFELFVWKSLFHILRLRIGDRSGFDVMYFMFAGFHGSFQRYIKLRCLLHVVAVFGFVR